MTEVFTLSVLLATQTTFPDRKLQEGRTNSDPIQAHRFHLIPCKFYGMKKKIKLISSFPQLPAAIAVATALACGSAHASTIDFDQPTEDYSPGASISAGAGDSHINAKDLLMEGKSFGAGLEEGEGSLTVNAKDALFGSFSQSIGKSSPQDPASYSTEFHLTGEFKATSGLSLSATSDTGTLIRRDNTVKK